MTWKAPDLSGRVAVVTGASRGVGKGIALALGECGATVYVTGRSTRGGGDSGRGTVEETAEAVSARGGAGVVATTDHRDDQAVGDLFARVQKESRRLDLLVANAWAGYEGHDPQSFSVPFWEQPLTRWDAMVDGGLRSHFTTTRAAAPAMIAQRSGLIVLTGGWDDHAYYLGNLIYDAVKAATDRMVKGMAHELRAHGVAAVGVYPGFTRTEAVVDAFATQGRRPPDESHSAEFVGRAIAGLLADTEYMHLSGHGLQAAALARRYGFKDLDGRDIQNFRLPEDQRLRPFEPPA